MIIAVAPWSGRHCDKIWAECVANSGLQLLQDSEVLKRGKCSRWNSLKWLPRNI